ncbi:unnamed protein product [Closterium sp. Yama58-4]|nr:unnamed protein product [Closterium sp. Yama58-4]
MSGASSCAGDMRAVARASLHRGRQQVHDVLPEQRGKDRALCAVIESLPLPFASLALAADKARRADLNRTLSDWKTAAAGRVRDIALSKLGLFRDERDVQSPWAAPRARLVARVRERLALTLDGEDVFAISNWIEACARAAFKPRMINGTVTLKLYHMAWLEHVVTDAIRFWETRKGRLSNTAGVNAQIVDGLRECALTDVMAAVDEFQPAYDATTSSWEWASHSPLPAAYHPSPLPRRVLPLSPACLAISPSSLSLVSLLVIPLSPFLHPPSPILSSPSPSLHPPRSPSLYPPLPIPSSPSPIPSSPSPHPVIPLSPSLHPPLSIPSSPSPHPFIPLSPSLHPPLPIPSSPSTHPFIPLSPSRHPPLPIPSSPSPHPFIPISPSLHPPLPIPSSPSTHLFTPLSPSLHTPLC